MKKIVKSKPKKESKTEELIKFIESKDWIVYSCGRSTDYIDDFCEEDSIENIINKIKEISDKEWK